MHQLFDVEDYDPPAAASSSPLPTIAVIGLGYVGSISAVKLARRGYPVIGVESNPAKLSGFVSGTCPVQEPGLQDAFDMARQAGRLVVTDDIDRAVQQAAVSMVCVGTPSDATGRVNLEAVHRVITQLAAALGTSRQPRQQKIVMIRSTVPPGTTQQQLAPRLRKAYPDVAVCHHPEFLREGTGLSDWDQPPMIVYGADDSDRLAIQPVIQNLYGGIEAPVLGCGSVESELLKYACNVFHAIKVDFANEIGDLARASGADPSVVMKAFCRDHRLNISQAYLKPAFAFGGSCLPKDTRALQHHAIEMGLYLPLIESVLSSNQAHVERYVQKILDQGRQSTLLIGLSFKPGTDDLRESPMVELAERLLGKGVPLTIYDPDLLPAKLVGANAQYIRQHLPHLKLLLRNDLDSAIAAAERVILAKPILPIEAIHSAGKTVVDLTGQWLGRPAAAVDSQTQPDGEPKSYPGSLAVVQRVAA